MNRQKDDQQADSPEEWMQGLRGLLDAAQAVLECTSFEEAARRVFDGCRQATGAVSGYVALLSPDGAENELVFLEAGGLPCDVAPDLPMPIRGLRAQAYEKGEVVYENDFMASEWIGYLPEHHVELRNVLFAPLIHGGRVVGIMGLANKPGDFTPRDAEVARAFGDLAAVALRRARNEEELRRAYDELAAHLDFHRSLMESLPVPVFSTDREGRYLDCNRAFAEMTGKPAAEIRGRTVQECWPGELAEEYHRKDLAILESGERQEYEFRVCDHEGRDRDVLFIKEPLRGLDGKVRGIVGAYVDITERRRLEAELRESRGLLDATGRLARVGGWELDAVTREVRWTRVTHELHGVPEGERPDLEGALAFFHPEDRPRLAAALEVALREGTPYDQRLRFRSQEGEELVVEVTCQPVVEQGRVVKLRGAFQDVTERVQEEAEKERLQVELAQSDRLASMGLLAAGVAHEINNPLAYVLDNMEGLVEELAAGDPGEDGAGPELSTGDGARPSESRLARARAALEGTRRIRGIVRSLRTFSRVENEAPHPIDLREAVRSAADMARNEVKYRARLELELGEVPPIRASVGRVSQVFLNLLINAAHAIAEGDAQGNEIRVRTRVEGEQVVAEVRDTGCGIPPDRLGRVFDCFFSSKRTGKGSGLGLAICKSMMEGFGGSIEVASEEGVGTCFTLRFPVAVGVDVAELGADPDSSGEGELFVDVDEGAEAARGRVLVVDDEEGIRMLVTRQLRRYHDVVAVHSGEAARDLLDDDPGFDVVLCDMMMPGMSGLGLYQWLDEHHPELTGRMVFMTGGAFTPRTQEFMDRIENPTLEKPFDKARLRELVAARVQARRG